MCILADVVTESVNENPNMIEPIILWGFREGELREWFGNAYVGGIHGRLLTAWAAAGIAGPVFVNTFMTAVKLFG